MTIVDLKDGQVFINGEATTDKEYIGCAMLDLAEQKQEVKKSIGCIVSISLLILFVIVEMILIKNQNMKGALGLLAISAVVWIFWMTYVHLGKSFRKNQNNHNSKTSKNED